MAGYQVHRRDVFVERACNWLLRNIATREYRAMINAMIHLGRQKLNDDITKIEFVKK